MNAHSLLIADIALALSSAVAGFITVFTVSTLMRLSRDESRPGEQQED